MFPPNDSLSLADLILRDWVPRHGDPFLNHHRENVICAWLTVRFSISIRPLLVWELFADMILVPEFSGLFDAY